MKYVQVFLKQSYKFSTIFIFVVFINAFLFVITSSEVLAARNFNGIVRDESHIRYIAPQASVQCVSNCTNMHWIDDHFDATFNSLGNVSVELTDYPSSFVSCDYEVIDRGPDVFDESDFKVIITGSGCTATFTTQYTTDWRYGVTFIIKKPEPTSPPSCTETNGDANGDGIANGNDFTAWLRNFDTVKVVGGGPSVGDFNCDGYVNGNDFTRWLNNFTY